MLFKIQRALATLFAGGSVVLLLAVFVVACAPTGRPAAGLVDVVLTPGTAPLRSCASPPLQGRFTLRRLDDRAGITVPGEELSRLEVIRRQLPAGLYSVTWTPDLTAEGDSLPKEWMLDVPALLSVFSGQVAILEVRRSTSECPSLDSSANELSQAGPR